MLKRLLITEIEIIPIKPRNGLVAFATCVINDSLYIGSIAIYTSPTRPEGYRLVYPSKALSNGKEVNCIHPINKETGEAIEEAILAKYQDFLAKMENKE